MSELSKEQSNSLVGQDAPHYYFVRIPQPSPCCGIRCCGTRRDLENVLQLYPDATWEKIYLPTPPQTVDVPYVTIAPDLELPMQQILPESQLKPFEPEL